MAWAMVIAAGLLEMVWSYSAKRSDGFTRLGWAGLTVIASLASFLPTGVFDASVAAWHSLRRLDGHRGNGKLFGWNCCFGRVRQFMADR